MDTKTKNKRQNRGSHLKNIRGSAFRKKFISKWLDDPENEDKHYKDAVKAYIEYKTDIAQQWARPVEILLANCEPCGSFQNYTDLLEVSKKNVGYVKKALTATANETIAYTVLMNDKWEMLYTTGWMSETDKYIDELTRPSGKTGKWITKLKTLCVDFQNIKSENEIVPGLQKIIDHCTYSAGDPEKNDKLPLYMYRVVHILYTEIAMILKEYSKFVTEEITNNHENQAKFDIPE